MLTELQAVNRLMRLAGLHQVDSLSPGDLTRDASLAQDHLDEENRRLQIEGWWFNSQSDLELTPDINDEILLPAETIKVFASRGFFAFSQDQEMAFRLDAGTAKLWNPEKGSFEWDNAVHVFIVVKIPFEDAPASFQEYVLTSAQILLLRHVSASRTVIDEARRDLSRAFVGFHQEETQQQRSRGLNLQVVPGVRDLLTKR